MNVGVPRETKPDEARVALTPAGTVALTASGHRVWVERGAGGGAGFADSAYSDAGAALVSREAVWERSDMIVKVKEPTPDEYAFFREGLVLFAYLHLAADRELTAALQASSVFAVAYETVQDSSGQLPLLAPMSGIAGRLAPQAGAWALERAQGGRGILIGGVPGVAPARVVIVGAGSVGRNAALVAAGMGADVWLLDRSVSRLAELESTLPRSVKLLRSDAETLAALLPNTDLLIGAVLVVGASAPRLITREMLSSLEPGSVLVDVAIDQGGCAETSRPTTHAEPVFTADGVVHYCVANMPGAVPVTATRALTNATLPYVLELADKGPAGAVAQNCAIAAGVNVARGRLTHAGVAAAFESQAVDLGELLTLYKISL
jgi:alanine dehydrogenase